MEKKIFEGENAFEDFVQSMKDDGLCGVGESLAKHAKKDSEIFFNAIVNPREPNKALREAAEEYKSLLK